MAFNADECRMRTVRGILESAYAIQARNTPVIQCACCACFPRPLTFPTRHKLLIGEAAPPCLSPRHMGFSPYVPFSPIRLAVRAQTRHISKEAWSGCGSESMASQICLLVKSGLPITMACRGVMLLSRGPGASCILPSCASN